MTKTKYVGKGQNRKFGQKAILSYYLIINNKLLVIFVKLKSNNSLFDSSVHLLFKERKEDFWDILFSTQ